jgi:hypothetical protein
MPQPTKAAPTGFEIDTAKRIAVIRDAGPVGAEKPLPQTERPALSAELLKELKRSLPAIEDSRIVEPLKPTPHSRLARMSICMDLSVKETTGALLEAYKRKNWKDVTITTPKNNDNYRSFSANSERFRLNGTTSQGEFEKCKKSLKQSRISLSFLERQPPRKDTEATEATEARNHGLPITRKATPMKVPAPKTLPRQSMHIAPTVPKVQKAPKLPKKDATKTELR